MAASSPMTRKRAATRRRAARRWRWLAIATVALLAATVTPQPLHAQDDWQHWGRDAGNQRHSPLTQINVDNVSTLVPAWRYEMRKEGTPSRNAQSTPLVVDGVLYLSFPFYRVVALEPETGDVIWEYTAPGDWNSPEHQLHYNGLGSMRGLAWWEGDDVTPPQIVFGTEEGELISLNAATGIPNPRFGSDGFVDLKTPEVMRGFSNMHYGISSGVAIYKHLVFTGVHNADETGSKGPAGRRAGVGSADGRSRLDVPHRAPARGGRQRDLAERFVERRHRRQQLELLHGRRRARHPLHAARSRRTTGRRSPRGGRGSQPAIR